MAKKKSLKNSFLLKVSLVVIVSGLILWFANWIGVFGDYKNYDWSSATGMGFVIWFCTHCPWLLCILGAILLIVSIKKHYD